MVDLLGLAASALLLLGGGALLFGLVSLADGIRFWRRMRRRLDGVGDYRPPAAILVPVRGVDPTLDRTVAALANQAYRTYRLLFLLDPDDTEAETWFRDRDLPPHAQVVSVAPRTTCSGKIAALLTGLDRLGPDDEVVVVADSDGVPHETWLAHLVAPLADPRVGGATGYRWYFPEDGGLGPALQAAWNSAAANVLFDPRWVYLWGGAMAVRREVLEELDVRERWQQVLSDDMVLTNALKEAGYEVRFVPRATVATFTDASRKEAVRWTHRQACLALLYAPAMKRLTVPYGLHVGSLLLAGVALALSPLGIPFLAAGTLLLSPGLLTLPKNALRRAAFRQALPAHRPAFRRGRLWFAVAVLLLPFLMLANVRRASRMDSFAWRGRVYRFAGPYAVRAEPEDGPDPDS